MTRPRQISDAQILKGAREIFLQQGAQVSTKAIARHIGVSQAVLFQRFGTKEGLMVAALAPSGELEWFESVAAGPDDRGMQVQLRGLADKVLREFERILPAMMVLKSAGLDLHELLHESETPPPLRAVEIMTSWFRRAKEQGRVGEVDPSTIALAFMGALQTRTFLRHIASENTFPVEREQYLDSLVELLWRGLRPKETH